jgi:hypothetical protein
VPVSQPGTVQQIQVVHVTHQMRQRHPKFQSIASA